MGEQDPAPLKVENFVIYKDDTGTHKVLLREPTMTVEITSDYIDTPMFGVIGEQGFALMPLHRETVEEIEKGMRDNAVLDDSVMPPLKPELQSDELVDPQAGDWVQYPGPDGKSIIRQVPETETIQELPPESVSPGGASTLPSSNTSNVNIEAFTPNDLPDLVDVPAVINRHNGTTTIGPSEMDERKALDKQTRHKRAAIAKATNTKLPLLTRLHNRIDDIIDSPRLRRIGDFLAHVVEPAIVVGVNMAVLFTRFM